MKNTSRIWRMLIAVAMVATVAACSDGELQLGTGPSISPPAPQIYKFEANPDQVRMGGSTVLSWEVVDADTVEISTMEGSAYQLHVGPLEDLTSSITVEDLTDTTEFVLTAYKTVYVAGTPEGEATPSESAEGEETEEIAPPAAMRMEKSGQIPIPAPLPVPETNPVTVTSTATTIVTIIAGGEVSADISANPDNIAAGESSILTWTATPDDADVQVSASSGERVVAAADCSTMTGALDNYPAVGCATVNPEATTTYTLKVINASGEEAYDHVTINVSRSDVEAHIRANGEENLVAVPSFAEPVTISYDVDPENAVVTVVADKPVDCTPELPNEEVLSGGTGSSQCTLTEDTRFDLIANGENEAAVVVAMQGGQYADADFSAQAWAFEGEQVTVTADPDAIEGSVRSAIAKIKIAGTEHTVPASGPLVVRNVLVPAVGVDASVVSTAGVEIKHPQIVKAINPIVFPVGEEVVEFSHFSFDKEDTSRAYVGVKKDGYQAGIVSAFKVNVRDINDRSEWKIDIGKILLATAQSSAYWNDGNGAGFFEMVKDYPVSAIAVDENRIFMGTTGALVVSEDDGDSWNKITTFLRFNAEDHKTCRGEIQAGNGDDLGSLGRACDLIARDNHLIIATDRGVLTVKDVSAFLQTNDAEAYVEGRPPAGPVDEMQFPTYAKVAHDLEDIETAVFAASEKGLFKSVDVGITWQKVEGIDEEIFAVAVDKRAEKIYVGTESAIKSRDLESGSWESKEIGQKVNSLAVDPYQTGVVMAGTSAGIYITRDGGENWSSVAVAGFEDKEIKSVAIAASIYGSNELNYSISFGGEGAAVASVVIGATVETPEGTPPEETPPEVTPEETPEGTPPEAEDGTASPLEMYRPSLEVRLPSS